MTRLARRLADFVLEDPLLSRAAALARETGCRILLVGGAVRDLALGRRAGDLDFVLEGSPRTFLEALAKTLRHRVVSFRKRGIVDHRVRAGDREWDFVETGPRTLRREILRRDFSLNAVAYDPITKEILDPGGGLRDLGLRRIRALSRGIFRDDPLRMLRAVRLRAEIEGLRLERRTADLIRRDARLLRRVSPERIKSEMDRILASPRPGAHVLQMERLGLLRQTLPELDPLRGLEQNRYHHLDAFRHTLAALAAADDLGRLARGLPSIVFRTDPLEVPSASAAHATTSMTTDLGPGALDGGTGRYAASRARGVDPAVSGTGATFGSDSRATPTGGARDESEERHLAFRTLKASRSRLLRWALLLHDTGKAETRTLGEDGEYHFYLHERASARIARHAFRRLRASREEIAAVERLVALHLRLSIPAEGDLTPRALRRIVRDAGGLTPLLVLHSLADKTASRGPAHARTLAALRRAGRLLLEMWRVEVERSRRMPRLLDGHDVMEALGLPPGRAVGELLAEIEELQAAGDLETRGQALDWLGGRGKRGSSPEDSQKPGAKT